MIFKNVSTRDVKNFVLPCRIRENNILILSSFRCLSADQPKHDGIKSRAKAVHQCLRPSSKTFHTSFNSWPESTLLLHLNQLPKKRVRTENVDELKQKILGGWLNVE